MIQVVLVDKGSGVPLHSEKYYMEGGNGRVFLVTNIQKQYGLFKTAAYTVQGTVEQVTPKGGESIELTDLIVTFEKKNLGVVTINFHDGTNTAPLVKSTLTDGPINMACNFVGKWHGWSDAHIDVVISGADSIGTVSIGYVKHPKANSVGYAAWNARR